MWGRISLHYVRSRVAIEELIDEDLLSCRDRIGLTPHELYTLMRGSKSEGDMFQSAQLNLHEGCGETLLNVSYWVEVFRNMVSRFHLELLQCLRST